MLKNRINLLYMNRRHRILAKKIIKQISTDELLLLTVERKIIEKQILFDNNSIEIERLENMDATTLSELETDEYLQIYDKIQDENGELHVEVYQLKKQVLDIAEQIIVKKEKLNEINDELEEIPELEPIFEPVPPDQPVIPVFLEESSQSTRLASLTLKNGQVILAHFRNGVIVSISKLTNYKNTLIPIQINEIGPYIAFTSLFTTEFYRMIHPFPTNSASMYMPYRSTNHQYGQFLDGLKRTTRPVRLIALCHGLICGVKKFNINVLRINNTVQGVCSFISASEKYRLSHYLTLPSTNEDEFIDKVKLSATKNIHDHFSVNLKSLTDETRGSNYKLADKDCKKYDESYEKCMYIKEAPFKNFVKNQPQFDKIFSGNPGLCFLFIGYSEDDSSYEYINLFTLQLTFTLEDIITNYIPHCKKLYVADFSCSNPCDTFYPTEKQKATCGGRKTKKRKCYSRSK